MTINGETLEEFRARYADFAWWLEMASFLQRVLPAEAFQEWRDGNQN